MPALHHSALIWVPPCQSPGNDLKATLTDRFHSAPPTACKFSQLPSNLAPELQCNVVQVTDARNAMALIGLVPSAQCLDSRRAMETPTYSSFNASESSFLPMKPPTTSSRISLARSSILLIRNLMLCRHASIHVAREYRVDPRIRARRRRPPTGVRLLAASDAPSDPRHGPVRPS